jgi:glycosyltransferase involved in cell wall biosynthesis
MNILMTPLLTGKPWNGTTIYNESLGGSEAAVAYMARALSRLGHTVVVLTHGPHIFVDNVQYVNTPSNEDAFVYLRGLPRIPQWDVVLSSRRLDVLEQPMNTKLIVFWTHDLPHRAVAPRCHVCFTLSKFHAMAWGAPPDMPAPYVITSDGVDISTVGTPLPLADRDPNKLVWVSNPDRGLPIAAHILNDIRQRWPEMELHVFGRSSVYGWPAEVEAPHLPRDVYAEGVILHDPLPRHLLFEELKTAWAMFYPTHWPETFCMAALEVQACGTPVIAPPLGALPETVKGGILTYDFLNAISQLRNKSRWRKLSLAGREFAEQHDWGLVAERWVKHFEERLYVQEVAQ